MSGSDYQKMAQQFLDMWQQNMTSYMRDPSFVRAMLDGVEQFNRAAHTFTAHDPNQAQARGTTVSDGAGHPRLDELERRLAACEARIALLESRSKPAKPKSNKS